MLAPVTSEISTDSCQRKVNKSVTKRKIESCLDILENQHRVLRVYCHQEGDETQVRHSTWCHSGILGKQVAVNWSHQGTKFKAMVWYSTHVQHREPCSFNILKLIRKFLDSITTTFTHDCLHHMANHSQTEEAIFWKHLQLTLLTQAVFGKHVDMKVHKHLQCWDLSMECLKPFSF